MIGPTITVIGVCEMKYLFRLIFFPRFVIWFTFKLKIRSLMSNAETDMDCDGKIVVRNCMQSITRRIA